MAYCAFDKDAALFDATPVDNMFISEYMLRAPGDYVKVYLYALMLCAHPSERMSNASMARDLDMTEEDVVHAFRYWSRSGLVRQVADNPPAYVILSAKQLAMTRAMQNLILIGHFRRRETDLWQEKTKVSRIWKTRSMLDLIMPAVLENKGGNWLLSVQPPQPIQSDESPMSESQLDATVSAIVQGKETAPAAMWQPEEPDPSPLKTSVTSLLLSGRQVTPDPEFTAPAPARVSVSVGETVPGFVPEEEETVETKRRPELPGFLLSPIPPRPAFMEEQHANAAEFGTQTHRFLRLIDLSAFRGHYTFEYKKLIEAEIVRMRDHAILSETEAASVFRNGILGFLMSPLGQRMLASPRVEREWPFTMQLRADSPTMVQGIVDAAFLEDDQWILLDYKTDKDTREGVFVPRHEKQMNWYRIAIERLTGLPVKEMWLYALRSSKAYQVHKLAL